MQVIFVHVIKGRGIVAVVDATDIPKGALKLGIFVHQGEKSWKIVGTEFVRYSDKVDYSTIGLVLSGSESEIPVEGELFL